MRDPTVIRALYNANVSALNRWKLALEDTLKGDKAAWAQMSELIESLDAAHRALLEESRHFGNRGRKVDALKMQ